jgi:hypothetical protein
MLHPDDGNTFRLGMPLNRLHAAITAGILDPVISRNWSLPLDFADSLVTLHPLYEVRSSLKKRWRNAALAWKTSLFQSFRHRF